MYSHMVYNLYGKHRIKHDKQEMRDPIQAKELWIPTINRLTFLLPIQIIIELRIKYSEII